MRVIGRNGTGPSPRGDTRGQALVEFALIALMMFLLILGMLELIGMMHTYNTLADAAKEGVRYAIVHGTNNSIPSGPPPGNTTDIDGPPAPYGVQPGYGSGYGVVQTFAKYSLHDISGITVTVNYPDTANGPANQPPNRVQVVVSYPFQPFFGLGWPTITVQAAAEGRIMN